jgi:hypothetical protein
VAWTPAAAGVVAVVLEREPGPAAHAPRLPAGGVRQHVSEVGTRFGAQIEPDVRRDDREVVLDGATHQVREVLD